MKRSLGTLAMLLALAVFTANAQQRYAMPRVSVAYMRATPAHSAEMVSQAVMGTPLKIISGGNGWYQVESPEGYRGHVKSGSLKILDQAGFDSWRKSPRAMVNSTDAVYACAFGSDDSIPTRRVTDLIPGNIVTVSEWPDGSDLAKAGKSSGLWVQVTLPDKRQGFVRYTDLMPLEQWSTQIFDPAKTVDEGTGYMGLQYLWGGSTVKGADCSGFTQMLHYRQGVLLPRDASQQVNVGEKIYDRKSDGQPTSAKINSFEKGDLLFFGTKAGRINHVGLYMGDGKVLHCSGMVRVNSLLPGNPGYDGSLYLLAARRIDPSTAHRLSVADNPMYFAGGRQ